MLSVSELARCRRHSKVFAFTDTTKKGVLLMLAMLLILVNASIAANATKCY